MITLHIRNRNIVCVNFVVALRLLLDENYVSRTDL